MYHPLLIWNFVKMTNLALNKIDRISKHWLQVHYILQEKYFHLWQEPHSSRNKSDAHPPLSFCVAWIVVSFLLYFKITVLAHSNIRRDGTKISQSKLIFKEKRRKFNLMSKNRTISTNMYWVALSLFSFYPFSTMSIWEGFHYIYQETDETD